MVEKKRVPTEKNPVGAAVLSAIFPGVGFFYIGNVVKGIAYILIFAALIVLEVESSRASENVVFGLMIGGFYIFQIFDSYNEAKKASLREKAVTNGQEKISLFGSVLILAIGIFFQLAELGVIRYRDVVKFWPIILIVLGARFIYTYSLGSKEEKSENGGEK
jgi:4-hydroxybenzoate polyprenyltransferase